MKSKKIILTLAMTLIIGLGTTAFVSANSATPNNFNNRTCTGTGTDTGYGCIANLNGHDILIKLLESKGLSDSQITNELNSGKTIYDILKEKGVTDEEIKTYMLNERIKSIDWAVSKGSITKEQGEEMKANIKENSSFCTPGSGNGGMRGRGNHNMNFNNTTN
ncbi:MAG: hypothetical protein ACM3X7_04855 [Solirubrobacterales bacterium]